MDVRGMKNGEMEKELNEMLKTYMRMIFGPLRSSCLNGDFISP